MVDASHAFEQGIIRLFDDFEREDARRRAVRQKANLDAEQRRAVENESE